MNTLRSVAFTAHHVLVTGANGHVGAMVVASLLRDCAARISCLVRAHHARSAVLAPIIDAWQQQSGSRWSALVEARLTLVTLPADLSDVPGLASELSGVDEIIHCAGCLDYNDTAKLRAANLVYTAHLIGLARRLAPRRLVYVSTAFSGGYCNPPDALTPDADVPEAALAEPAADPTPYTLTKRHAERLVAASGIPFIVIRPSVLIGNSSSGRYRGKRYGLYQQWMSLAELLCDRWHAEVHAVASDARPNLLHEDAFCAAFKAAHRWLPDGSHMNLVSGPQAAPSLRQLWDMWFAVTRPALVRYYPRMADIALRQIPLRQRAYLTFARVNLEIAAHDWRFQTGWLDALRANGLLFADASQASVQRCQDRFVAGSATVGGFLAEQAARLVQQPMVIDVVPADVRTQPAPRPWPEEMAVIARSA